jgi:EAL domain-containing protein (putative c-di-GMP-specific phosphodiesterase class I)
MDEVSQNALTEVLGRGQLVLHYQPIADAQTGATRSLETLARWQTAGGSLREADWLFGRVADRPELVSELDRMALALMLEERATFAPLRDAKISLNQDRGSVSLEAVRAFVDSCAGREGGSIAVELFEHLDADQLASMPALAEEFADAGIELWHDDFGTGERALAHLIALPSTVVKLCPEIAADGVQSARVRRHVRSLIAMLHNLGKIVVAKGVGDAASAEWLSDAGADWLQGKDVAKPMPALEAADWLQNWEPRAA